jgi:hypothetical protein
LQAPPGVVRWSLDGLSCKVDYRMVKKTPWGNPGEGGGGGGALCPWAPHISLGAGGDDYSRGVLFSDPIPRVERRPLSVAKWMILE